MIEPSLRATLNRIRKDYGIIPTIKEIFDMWNQPHRYYHNVDNHLVPMLNSIISGYVFNDVEDNGKKIQPNTDNFSQLIIATLFHDIIYDPKSDTNESDSVDFMLQNVKETSQFFGIANLIMATKNHEISNDERLEDYYELHRTFIGLDLEILTSDFNGLLEWEKQIQKEYEFVNWKTYKEKRIEILSNLIKKSKSLPIDININGLKNLISYIENHNTNIAIYPGSFNPFHKGHLDILNKAEKIFDKVIIAKGRNDSKNVDEIEFEDGLYDLKQLFPSNEIIAYEGLLTDLIETQEGNITLIRGLRNGYDLDAENTLMAYMKDLLPSLQIIYLPCDNKYQHISSSAIRKLRKYGSDKIEKYLP